MRPWAALGRNATGIYIYIYILHNPLKQIAQSMLHVHLFLTMICYQPKGFNDPRAAHKQQKQQIIPEKGTVLTHVSNTLLVCDKAVLIVLDGSRLASRLARR